MAIPAVVQLGVSAERLAEMEALAMRCGHAGLPDLFNAAMTLIEWAADEAERGCTVGSINSREKSYVALDLRQVLPALVVKRTPDNDV